MLSVGAPAVGGVLVATIGPLTLIGFGFGVAYGGVSVLGIAGSIVLRQR